jgi:hypothetical protein
MNVSRLQLRLPPMPLRRLALSRRGSARALRRLQLPMSTACAIVCIGASAAHASPAIEGVWSFNGGAVDIQAQPGNTFRGVVTAPTKFAQCSHPINEDVWSTMTLQPDGSYFGFHQWYFEGTCARNPEPGPTAWRVLRSSNGELFLRVCFSAPGSGSQPTIAPDGTSAHVTYGCTDSASIAPIPTVAANQGAQAKAGQIGFRQTVGLPSARQCVRRHTLRIVLHNPAYDPLKEVVVRVGKRRVADVRSLKKLRRPIVLGGLPGGSFKVKVLAITVLDQRLSGSRTYHSCRGTQTGRIKLRRLERHRSRR